MTRALETRAWEKTSFPLESCRSESLQLLDLHQQKATVGYDSVLGSPLAAENAGAGYATSNAQAQNLARQLTSEEQMGQALSGQGTPLIGAGTDKALLDADRLAQQYGGNPGDWAKMGSESSAAHGVQTPAGDNFETHWYQNVNTGQVVEIKTKIAGH